MAILAKMQRTSRGGSVGTMAGESATAGAALANNGATAGATTVAATTDVESILKNIEDLETCKVGRSTFTFPFEMLELPDLRNVLSLETWNYVLSEEEREHLMGFLPSGLSSKDDFSKCLKQLLGGENFDFGNPVDGFLEELKKGHLHPSVVSYKKASQALQKKEYYHFLKSYHNGMVSGFLEMQKLWEEYPEVDLDGRVEIWLKYKETNVKPEHPASDCNRKQVVRTPKAPASTSGRPIKDGKGTGVLKVKVKPLAGGATMVKQEEQPGTAAARAPKTAPVQKLTKFAPRGILKTTKKTVPEVVPAGSDSDTSSEGPDVVRGATSSSLSSEKKRKNVNGGSASEMSNAKKAKAVDSGTSSDGVVSVEEATSDDTRKRKWNRDSSESPPEKKKSLAACAFPFSVVQFLSAVRRALLLEMDENDGMRAFLPLHEILRRVEANPGDVRVLEADGTQLQDLVWGALKVLSSKTAPAGGKGWRPLVAYGKETKCWTWVGPGLEVPESEGWGIPSKMLGKLEDAFATWYKHGEETRQHMVQLQGPPAAASTPLDERERFRDLRAQKSLITIAPSSNEVREYFRKEEVLRYAVPDRAFSYTRSDGHKSVVAPLRRGGGKPNSKARDHFMLRPDRPPHVTVLCLVRDAAARLPGGIGTRADVCALIRDSQYIVEEVTDSQVNAVVSGALDRLHYEVDPCVKFDSERKLWMYLHTDRNQEDFEDDGTSSTKRWKKLKKESMEEFSPSDGGAVADSIYSADHRTELVYNRSGSLSSPRVLPSLVADEVPLVEMTANRQAEEQLAWHSIGTVWSEEAEQRLMEQAAAKAAAEAAAAAAAAEMESEDVGSAAGGESSQ